MSRTVDLADPTFEPSGAELQALASRAFAGLKQTHEQSLERIRAEVARQRHLVLDALRRPIGPEREPDR